MRALLVSLSSLSPSFETALTHVQEEGIEDERQNREELHVARREGNVLLLAQNHLQLRTARIETLRNVLYHAWIETSNMGAERDRTEVAAAWPTASVP